MADALEQLYQQVILDHSRERHGAGALENYDGESFQVNPTCGDEARLWVRLDSSEDGTDLRIAGLGWEGHGCSISQASLSVMHDLVDGTQVSEAEELGETFRELMRGRGRPLADEERQERLEDASAFVGVAKYPARIKCALLGWMALHDALLQARVSRTPSTED
ncbi:MULTISPECIES: Fe-S cluster assembly sulfur transfer protein SufU [Actinomycetes]|uniref:SUF system NifU family Fe-S cluster assembly protein n=2 Tax=Actinomycetes TaxID=1760 RepID=A0ABP6LNP2_9MICC|nr:MULTISPECIES: SUF system NifU family Fe-S cluster assembly protein [unclassified Nesterenkonia]MDS2171995.1 SUF system NifU family Fe-S cluster assembly protein [Nesterenkonia sp. CL21]OSM43890.1 SUF system NifU family Fe-S cluster assembly protein [Nesterenkonia sp. PF2B19]